MLKIRKLALNKRSLLNIILRLVGLALFIWVVSQVDLPTIFGVLTRANLTLLIFGILLAAPTVLIRSWRLQLILNSFGLHMTLPQTLLIRLVGAAAGDMMPGRTGEIVSVAYLQQGGYGLRDPALTLILDRLFDFFILAIWAVAGLAIIGNTVSDDLQPLSWTLALGGLGFGLLILLLIVMRSKLTKIKLPKWLSIPHRFRVALGTFMNGEGSRDIHWNWKVTFFVAGTSILSFLFLVLRGFLLARSIGIDLSFSFLSACMAITTLLQLIPVSNVLGIGTREVSLVYLFNLVGIPAEMAVGFSFMIVIALLAQDIVGLILWWRFPVGTPFLKQHVVLPISEVLQPDKELEKVS